MAIFSIFNVKSVVAFYLTTCIVATSNGESEIGELPFCGHDNFNTEHR
jgi:hypothetical protein